MFEIKKGRTPSWTENVLERSVENIKLEFRGQSEIAANSLMWRTFASDGEAPIENFNWKL